MILAHIESQPDCLTNDSNTKAANKNWRCPVFTVLPCMQGMPLWGVGASGRTRSNAAVRL